jgi:virginiamycin A acetyltransferase
MPLHKASDMARVMTLKPGRFAIEMTRELVAELHRYGIHFSTSGENRYRPGDRVRFSSKTLVERYSGYLRGDNLFSLGAFSYSLSELNPRAKVGRYCSIGEDVSNFGGNHPVEFLSSSPFFYEGRKGYFNAPLIEAGISPRKIDTSSLDRSLGVIQNDVWVGSQAMIGWDLTVGTGSVIAAGAVVTKDIEPYSIAAGVPAKVVRKRFPEKTIERLLASRWWDYNFAHFYDLDFTNPDQFLDAFEALRDSGVLTPLAAPRPFLDVLTELGFA